ncbi:MAG: hypothetical protein ACM3SP_11185 [Chloroflexota bacterium]
MTSRWYRSIVWIATLVLLAGSGAPAYAGDVDQRIRDLEAQVGKLKPLEQELEQLKAEQVEMKKEATAAAATMPTFSYRPGSGMMIEAADKSWSFRTGIESHFRMLFESGLDQVGRTNGEVMARRFRPYFNYCIDNCLWELEVILDLDGFGTGNAKNATGTGVGSILHRGALNVHLEHLHPWLPTAQLGMDVSASINSARQGSSGTGTQAEYDLLSRNSFDDGSSGNGIVLNWDNRPLDAIGIPGRINRFQVAMANVKEGDDGLSRFTDRKDFVTYLGIEPFSQLKNKWISGLKPEMGAWFCNNDPRALFNACNQLQIQDLGNGGRQTLFSATNIGKGLATLLMPGLTWEVGPYTLRVAGGFQRYADKGGSDGKKQGNMFLIGHDLFVWSPKGFFTGSASTTGSVLFGTHFERTDVSCTTAVRCSSINGGAFHRNRIILREWDLFYFVAPRMSVGGSVLWYNASNLPSATQINLGIRDTAVAGKGGEWVDGMLNFRYQF